MSGIDFESMTVAQLARHAGMAQSSIMRRLQEGMTKREAATIPARAYSKSNLLLISGEGMGQAFNTLRAAELLKRPISNQPWRCL